MTRAPEPNDLAEGTRLLDRYVILDRVGSGGMASIYRATDERLDRVVCVKLLRTVLGGSSGDEGRGVYRATYAHFLKEALALSRLSHPNTLRIYDFGYLGDGRPFQISEFLDGGSLEMHVRARGPLPADEVLAILERITGAVAEAHAHGIIHRDIKPSNILFSRVARERAEPALGILVPKLADFGIAQSKLKKRRAPRPIDAGAGPDAAPPPPEPSDDDAVSAVALFSPRWAAPEQLAGADEGPATDVYALGLVTAYMLTGRVPFADPDVRAHFAARMRGDAFVDARLDELGIAGALKGALLAGLAADPARRVPSPAAFLDAVRDAIHAQPELPARAREPFESITLVLEAPSSDAPPTRARDAADAPDAIADARDEVDDLPREPVAVAPPEQVVEVGGRRVRVVTVPERLDVTMRCGDVDVRFRLTILPAVPRPHGAPAHASDPASDREPFALHVKGLSCFVSKAGRPTPAIVATTDGSAQLVSGDRTVLGALAWTFGVPNAPWTRTASPDAGRVFTVNGAELVVPYTEASQAVALDLGGEMIVMCRR